MLSLINSFVPLIAGMFSKKATSAGAIASMFAGRGAWLMALNLQTDVNPMLYGFAGSMAGLLTGMLWRPLFAKKNRAETE